MFDFSPPNSFIYIFFVLYWLCRLFYIFLFPTFKYLYSYLIAQPLLRGYLLSLYCVHDCANEEQKNKDNSFSGTIRGPWISNSIQTVNPVTEEDKQYARKYPNSNYSLALASNPNYMFDKQDIEFIAVDEPVSAFTDKLLKKYNYLKIDSSAIQCFREGHSSFLAGLLTSSPMYKIEFKDKEIARLYPYSYFALGVALNAGYKIEPVDLLIARQNPESCFAMALERKFNFNDEGEIYQDYI